METEPSISTTISIISTLILTVLTGIYVWLTHKISKTNTLMLQEQIRPYVIVHCPLEDKRLKIIVANIGQRPAYNVKIDFIDKQLIENLIIDKKAKTIGINPETSIFKFLPPSQNIIDFINFSATLVGDMKDKLNDLKVKVDYEDSFKNKYSEEYVISIESYVFSSKAQQLSNNFLLEEISKSIKDIAKRSGDK